MHDMSGSNVNMSAAIAMNTERVPIVPDVPPLCSVPAAHPIKDRSSGQGSKVQGQARHRVRHSNHYNLSVSVIVFIFFLAKSLAIVAELIAMAPWARDERCAVRSRLYFKNSGSPYIGS